MGIEMDQICCINSRWDLRRNGSRSILLYDDPMELKYIVLNSSVDAVTLSLFNGKRSFQEVCEAFSFVFKSNLEWSIKLINAVISSLNANNPPVIVPKDSIAEPCREYDSSKFLYEQVTPIHPNRLEVPLVLGITPTNRCKTNCIYCYAERRKILVSAELSTKEWKTIIDQAAELGIDRIELLGGDLFARNDAIELIEYLIQKNVYFFLSTKCHVDEAMAKRLHDAGLGNRFIQISLDAPDRQMVELLTGCRGAYDNAVDSIKNSLKYGLRLRVKATLTALNARSGPALLRMLYEMGVRSMMLIDYGRSYYRHDEGLFCKPEDSLWVKDEIEKLRLEMPDAQIIYGAQASDALNTIKSAASIEEKWKEWSFHKRCSGGSSLMHITADGYVKLCEQVPEKEAFFVGNIREQSIMEIWNSKRLLDFIYPDVKYFAGTKCDGCESFEDCHRASGHCFRDALFTNGTRFSPMPQCPLSGSTIRMN